MSFEKSNSFFRAMLVVSVVGLAAGCSTTGSLNMHETQQGHSIKGAVASLTTIAPDEKGNDTAIQLRGQVAAHLLGAGLFKSISNQGEKDSDFNIAIKLTEIDEVSGVSRVLLGVLAGSNKIAGDVIVTDARSGQTVRSFSFLGESASHPFSGKSDIKDAINKSAEEIIKGLN
jgi:hypothetical protein